MSNRLKYDDQHFPFTAWAWKEHEYTKYDYVCMLATTQTSLAPSHSMSSAHAIPTVQQNGNMKTYSWTRNILSATPLKYWAWPRWVALKSTRIKCIFNLIDGTHYCCASFVDPVNMILIRVDLKCFYWGLNQYLSEIRLVELKRWFVDFKGFSDDFRIFLVF